MTPNDVLDLNLDQLESYILGYSESMFDRQQDAVETGFWCGYYSNSKHPKPPSTIIDKMKVKRAKKSKGTCTEDPDVALYEAREERRKKLLESQTEH